ncbi:hypothetical protein TRAPUB_1946 [Trametes pubescens]|uniref:Uncharacterized protein n=1 Tax=Trametes pubescens TaxID=154538 RepID=A0A1M2VI15_TRAPU|nr:hypothetical protein TRAPUB_1946 [Trametes pubescens]
MAGSTPALPPELCDYILDQLADDKRTLRSCALTSRQWLPRAQHNLFRSIYIDWSNCSAFSRLLSANPLLTDHVRTLEIESAFGIFSMDRLHGATLDAWLHAIPPWMPARLANLTKLELALLTIDADLARGFFNRLRGVTHLTLWACTLKTFDVFTEMYLSFPGLKRLTIAFTQEWESNPRGAVAPLAKGGALPQLEVLELTSGCDNFKVLSWLVAEDLHRAVHTLSCTRVPWAELSTLGELLNELAPTLKQLRIGLGESASASGESPTPRLTFLMLKRVPPAAPPRGTDWTAPIFSPLPALHTLTLDIHTARLSAVPYTLSLLAQLAVPALRTLAFAVKCGEFDTAFLIPWARVADVAARFHGHGGGRALECVRVGVKERPRAGPPVVHVDARAGTVGVGGMVDFAEMERSVREAFGAKGMGKLVVFERVVR